MRRSLPPLSSLLPFEAAARLQSITEAAQELSLTQAAISKQIKALETDLGTQLFERRNRAIYLTREGKRMHHVIQMAFGDIAAISNAMRQPDGTGEIVLRAQQCEAIYWLMPRLSGFYLAHPEIDLRVNVSTTPLSDAQDRYDLALQSIDRDQGHAHLVHKARDAIFPVCAPTYLPAGTALSPSDLKSHKLLHHRTTRQDWMTWEDWHIEARLPPRDTSMDLSYDSFSMVMQAAIEGHGIALGWQRTCEHLLKTGALIRPCVTPVQVTDGLGLYAPRAGALPDKAQILLDWLIAELA